MPDVRGARKRRDGGGAALVMVTAYDEPSGPASSTPPGSTCCWSGDSVANNVLGYEDTLHVTIDDMAHHVAAVARARPALPDRGRPALDELPPARPTRRCATPPRLVRAGARAVKLEGGRARLPVVEAIIGAEIPVMGHLGLTPQSVLAMGGYRVQARSVDAAQALLDAAKALAAAGCFAIVLEGVPDVVAAAVTEAVDVPTIGIGAGPALRRPGPGLPRPARAGRRAPRRSSSAATPTWPSVATAAVAAFADDVRSGRFPADAESYHASAELTRRHRPRRRLEGRRSEGPVRASATMGLVGRLPTGVRLRRQFDTLPRSTGPGRPGARSGGR